jgi:hypothetical protein
VQVAQTEGGKLRPEVLVEDMRVAKRLEAPGREARVRGSGLDASACSRGTLRPSERCELEVAPTLVRGQGA